MAAVCDRFAMQILVLAEQQREALDHLEQEEQDADKLKRLYEVDHAVALMRRAARELRVLSDRDEAELGGQDASLMDVVRMATSSIESYARVRIGTVPELAVLAYAADDVASLLAPLLDNATRYSPATVSVSAHPTEHGGVVIRIVDSGIGLKEEQVHALNTTMAGAVPPMSERTGKHTGFPVVHRLARRHGAQITFTARPPTAPGDSGGTTVVAALPPQLICEVPAQQPALGEFPAPGDFGPPEPVPSSASSRPSHLRVAPGPIGPDSAPPPEPDPPQRPPAGDLPQRERQSLRRQGRDGGGGSPRWPERPLAKESGSSGGGPVSPPSGGSFAHDLDSFAAGDRSDSAADAAPRLPERRTEN